MFPRPKELSLLELALDRAIRELGNHTIGSEDYMKTLEIVSKLHKMKIDEKSSPLSKDAMLSVGANLLGIAMIIKSEVVGNFISSKALNFVLRPR